MRLPAVGPTSGGRRRNFDHPRGHHHPRVVRVSGFEGAVGPTSGGKGRNFDHPRRRPVARRESAAELGSQVRPAMQVASVAPHDTPRLRDTRESVIPKNACGETPESRPKERARSATILTLSTGRTARIALMHTVPTGCPPAYPRVLFAVSVAMRNVARIVKPKERGAGGHLDARGSLIRSHTAAGS